MSNGCHYWNQWNELLPQISQKSPKSRLSLPQLFYSLYLRSKKRNRNGETLPHTHTHTHANKLLNASQSKVWTLVHFYDSSCLPWESTYYDLSRWLQPTKWDNRSALASYCFVCYTFSHSGDCLSIRVADNSQQILSARSIFKTGELLHSKNLTRETWSDLKEKSNSNILCMKARDDQCMLVYCNYWKMVSRFLSQTRR